MMYASIRRPALLIVLGAVLVSSPALAASPSWRFAEEVGRGVWTWLAEFLPVSQRAEIQLGCSSIDLSGQEVCELASPAPAPKHGCSINPDGTPRCDP